MRVACLLVDFQKITANIREFQLKLGEDVECAEVRDALNYALLQLQRYFRKLRNLAHRPHHQQQHDESVLTQSLSPMTPLGDAPERFSWRWVDVDADSGSSNIRTLTTLSAQLDKEAITVPALLRAARNSDNNSLVQLIEHGNSLQLMLFCFSEHI